MAETDGAKILTLSEEYLLTDKEAKLDASTKPTQEREVKSPVAEEEVVTSKTEEAPVTTESSAGEEVVTSKTEEVPVTTESSEAVPAVAEENKEVTPSAGEDVSETAPAVEESSESAELENSDDQEAVEEKPEIKLETAPADFRFPTTNQSRHCFTRYIEYHRCVAAKGDDALECDKFAKYYRSLCPGEWVDRWNEQRENGTFPGPL